MKRSPEIQGLRALAVLLVLAFHADWLPGGYIGVDVFYVISGFLITGLILKEENFSFVNFYARRAKRLLPAAYMVLAVSALLFFFFAPAIGRAQFSKDLLGSTWYLSNYLYAHWQNDYQNLGATPSPLIHYWSLAVEEQFYIFWPLIIILGRKRLKLTITVTVLVSFALSIYLIAHSPIFAFYSLPTRAFELGIGALLAVSRIRTHAGWFGLALILGSAFIFDSHTAFPGFAALLPVLGAAALLSSTISNPILRSKVAQRFGDWSYSIYLWHWPLLIIPTLALQRELSNFEKAAALFICVLLAAFTYKVLENPIRHKKVSNQKVLLSTLTAGVILSLTAFGINATAATTDSAVRQQPIIYADGCQLDKQAVKPKASCIYGDKNATKSVVLFGDSHAAQWFPAVDIWAKDRGYKLIVMTKSSCPALDFGLKDNGAFKAAICNQYRLNAMAEIQRLAPSLVIIGSFEHYADLHLSNNYLTAKRSYPVLILRDTPWPNRDIPTCLTTKANCDTPRPALFNYGALPTFNPIPLLCDAKCPAKVDGLIAYRDQTHITVAIAQHFASQLGQKIDSLVAG